MAKPCIQCGSTERYKNGDCAPCARERAREYHNRNPKTEEQKKRIRDNAKKWDMVNRSGRSEISRRWRENNPDKAKEVQKRHYYNNRDKCTARSRSWYARNQERAIETARSWQRNNPEQVKAIKNNRRVREYGADGAYTAQEFSDLCDYYDNKCLCCKREGVKLTADHVVPISRGGSGGIDNIQPLCRRCNSKKHAKTIDYRTKPNKKTWIQRALRI